MYQVDVKCCCVFLSLSVGSLSEPSPYIPLNVRSTMSDQPATDTLVFCLPNLKLYSSGGRSLSRGMDVPVTNLEGPLTGEGKGFQRVSIRDLSNLYSKCMNYVPSGGNLINLSQEPQLTWIDFCFNIYMHLVFLHMYMLKFEKLEPTKGCLIYYMYM